MAERIYKILEKTFVILFYIILFGLFLKGEIFRIHTGFFSLTFTSVKNFVYIFIVLWVILSFILTLRSGRGLISRSLPQVSSREKPKISIYIIPLILLIIFSMAFSQYSLTSLKAGSVLLTYILWFYSLKTILSKDKYIINSVGIFIILSFIVNIMDMYFHYSLGLHEIVEKYPFWQGKNALGLFLVMALCLSANLFVENKWKWYIRINSLLLVVGIILSYSRGAWIAWITAIVGTMFFRFKQKFWIILGSIAVLVIVSPSLISNRVNSIFSGADENVKQRLEVWSNTVKMIKDRPFFGTGLGTFKESYIGKYSDIAPREGEGSRPVRHAHNLYLQMLAETGIIGLACTVFLIIIGFFYSIKNFVKDKSILIKSIRYGSMLGILSFLVYSVTDCTTSWQFVGDSFSHINLIWIMLWVLALRPCE